jgi:hypothetical protein
VKRIEFIGGPAIGKSTVLKEVIKMRKHNDCWKTAEEARLYLAKTIETKTNRGKLQRLARICLKLSLTKFQNFMASIILNEYKDTILDCLHEKYSDIVDIFLVALFKNDRINSIDKIRLAVFYFDLLLDNVMLFDYFKLNNIIVYDEGIIHNNSAFRSIEKSGKVLDNHIRKNTNVVPVGIIYCYMNLERYIKRRKERIIKGNGIFLDRKLNNFELEDLCRESLKSAKDKINVLRLYKVPVLEIDMEEPVIDNAKKAYEFINGFQYD